MMVLPSASVASDEVRSVMVMAGGRVRKQTDFGERHMVAAVGVRSAAGRSAAILEWAREVQTCGEKKHESCDAAGSVPGVRRTIRTD